MIQWNAVGFKIASQHNTGSSKLTINRQEQFGNEEFIQFNNPMTSYWMDKIK
jgi:hypothetical protein